MQLTPPHSNEIDRSGFNVIKHFFLRCGWKTEISWSVCPQQIFAIDPITLAFMPFSQILDKAENNKPICQWYLREEKNVL